MLSHIKTEVQKGFTLIELLIVIAILAILTTIVVVVLNPAELLAQGRDSQRLSDLSSLRSGLVLYLKDKGCKNDTTWEDTLNGADATMDTFHSVTGGSTAQNVYDSDRTVDGTGWVPLNLTTMSTGSPFGVLPTDPTNTFGNTGGGTGATDQSTFFHYHFKGDTAANNCAFELNANMESVVSKRGGSDDKETNTKDGGDSDNLYEVGTDPGLNLIAGNPGAPD